MPNWTLGVLASGCLSRTARASSVCMPLGSSRVWEKLWTTIVPGFSIVGTGFHSPPSRRISTLTGVSDWTSPTTCTRPALAVSRCRTARAVGLLSVNVGSAAMRAPMLRSKARKATGLGARCMAVWGQTYFPTSTEGACGEVTAFRLKSTGWPLRWRASQASAADGSES